ncbi:MAG: cache domain-containing protein [Candidatus Nomurabacteria bacterium]|nr:cache domain-containing protein [Candidatus Nomurabacteria bacterium]
MKKISIANKIVILTTVLVVILFSLSFGFVILKVRTTLTEASIKNLETEIERERSQIESLTQQAVETVEILANLPPTQGIIRAQKNNGVDPFDGSTTKIWGDRLSTIFFAEMNSIKIFDQLRYIDTAGQELIRVDYKNGKAVRISDDLLQNKSDRDYVIETNQKNPEEIYVSYASLNREGTPPIITKPYKPIIRYAFPIFDESTGERKGMIIANVLLDELLIKSKLNQNSESNIYIIDREGFFLVNPDETKEWGEDHDLDTGITFKNEFPNIDQDVFESESGYFVDGNNLFTYVHISPGDEEEHLWRLIQQADINIVLNPINNLMRSISFIGVGVFILLFFLFRYLVSSMLLPLRNLSLVATQIGKGNFDQKIEVKTHDEVGQLGRVLNTVSSELKNLYADLERKVGERTKELEDAKNKFQKQAEVSERSNKLMVGRELKMVELKKEIEELKNQHDR